MLFFMSPVLDGLIRIGARTATRHLCAGHLALLSAEGIEKLAGLLFAHLAGHGPLGFLARLLRFVIVLCERAALIAMLWRLA
jgi:hypothetical protein